MMSGGWCLLLNSEGRRRCWDFQVSVDDMARLLSDSIDRNMVCGWTERRLRVMGVVDGKADVR